MKRKLCSLLVMTVLLVTVLLAAPTAQAALAPGGSGNGFSMVFLMNCGCATGGNFERTDGSLTVVSGQLDEYNMMELDVTYSVVVRCKDCESVYSFGDSISYTYNFCRGRGDGPLFSVPGIPGKVQLFVRGAVNHFWTYDGTGNHTCSACGDSEKCVPLDGATCVHGRPCVTCGGGPHVNPENHEIPFGGNCSTYVSCGCANPITINDPNRHDGLVFVPGTPVTCTTDGVKDCYLCNDCGQYFAGATAGTPIAGPETVPAAGHTMTHTPALAPSCGAGGNVEYYFCSGCSKYFRDAQGTEELTDEERLLPATGHNYMKSEFPNGCLRDGYTLHTCAYCGHSYKDNIVPGYPHYYGLWSHNGNGTHSADCINRGCKKVGLAWCDHYTVTQADGTELKCCPVCGTFGKDHMSAMKFAVRNLPGDRKFFALPGRGEPIVRGIAAPFDDVLFALSVAHEYCGITSEFRGEVRVETALEGLPEDFRLVRVDSADGEESWTELDWSYNGATLAFDTDTSGIFLILPAE